MQTVNESLSIGRAIWLLCLTVVLMLILAVGLGLLTAAHDVALILHPGAMATVQLVGIGTVLLLYATRTRTRMSFGRVFPLRRVRRSILLPVIPTVIGASILLSEADNLLRLVLPMPEAMTSVLSSLVGNQGNLWWSVLAVAVVAPLAEEFLFRGLVLNGLLRRYSPRKSIVASALLFGAFHLNPWQFVGGTFAGLLFGWWFVRTRSLIPSIMGHAVYNVLPLILMGVLHVQVPGYTASLGGAASQPAWFTACGVVLVGTGLVMLVRAFTKTADTSTASIVPA